jgi:CDGSH-type Zn-finger protein
MKSEPRGKSMARDLAYIPYVKDGLDFELQMNYLIDFSWQIFDENLYVIATGDIFPSSMLKDAVGDTAKINITRYYKTPVSSIPEAEIPPSELIPGIIEKVNELAKGYGIEVTNARFNDFSVSEADKMRIHRMEKEMEKARLYSAIAKGASPVIAASAVQAENPVPKPQEKVLWLCKCGAQNKTNFCSECGSPKDFDYWICSCGTKNHGKFCMECGRKLEKY